MFTLASLPLLAGFKPSKISVYTLVLLSLAIIANGYVSLNPSAGYFLSLQYLIYALAFFVFRFSIDVKTFYFFNFVFVAGALSAAVTMYQMATHRNPCGLLPVNHNFNAVWLAVAAICLAGHGRLFPGISLKRQIGAFSLSGVLALLVIMGPSRSALVGLMAAFVLVCCRLFSPKARVRTLALLIPAFVVLLSLSHRFRFDDELDLSNGRWNIWTAAWEGLKDHPWKGYGVGNFETAYLRHAPALMHEFVRFGKTTRFAHCDFLQILVEWGIPAGSLILTIMAWPLLGSFRSQRPLVIIFSAAYLCILISAVSNITLQMPFLALLAVYFATHITVPSSPNE